MIPRPDNPLIVALDVSDLDAADRIAERLAPEAGMLKIGLELFAAAGPGGRAPHRAACAGVPRRQAARHPHDGRTRERERRASGRADVQRARAGRRRDDARGSRRRAARRRRRRARSAARARRHGAVLARRRGPRIAGVARVGGEGGGARRRRRLGRRCAGRARRVRVGVLPRRTGNPSRRHERPRSGARPHPARGDRARCGLSRRRTRDHRVRTRSVRRGRSLAPRDEMRRSRTGAFVPALGPCVYSPAFSHRPSTPKEIVHGPSDAYPGAACRRTQEGGSRA